MKAYWDHPRVCGEHKVRSRRNCLSVGSSPRMRGAPAHHEKSHQRHRINPAYAGSTDSGVTSKRCHTDHPRVCGEHGTAAVLIPHCQGSSPRMRGAQSLSNVMKPANRIIPAYAGSTPCSGRLGTCGWDHPRVCGEHCACAWDKSTAGGSSPRMRGARHADGRRFRRRGIIPAYAGSTPLKHF